MGLETIPNNLYEITRPFSENPPPGSIPSSRYKTDPSSGGEYDLFAPKQPKTNGSKGESPAEESPEEPLTDKEDEDAGTVGKPGFWESLIPVWGSGREAIYHFQKGNYGQGIFFSLLAITDVFLVGVLVKAIVKTAGKIAAGQAAKKLVQKEIAKKAERELAEKAATKTAPKAAGEVGKDIIQWGRGLTEDAVAQTVSRTQALTQEEVQKMISKGLTKEWVEEQLALYRQALVKGEAKLRNRQLIPRKNLMERILQLWPN